MTTTDVPEIRPEDIQRLAPKVEQWFREAAPPATRFSPPSPRGCRMVAFYLLVFRASPKPSRKQSVTVKYAKTLLGRLVGEEESVASSIDLMLSGDPAPKRLQEAQEFQAKVHDAKQAIERLLPLLSPMRDPDLDPIRRLAAVAREAWEETNAGQSPQSDNPDDPVCKFLTKALEGHQDLGRDGISDILRGRRRN